ncbi:hypothetical protein PGT21_013977 [Puccinia graminis f. sp. tritici]|uniref:Uncharacterized protein n=1 Tax=Puccinia graminis f. sp. tritici TaxID=56615 RepID=A0A5B0NYH0_PUCGR|nr:hypothetical protein PGT21_013977 [Puccinia graminis f. sp. tritici]
MSWNTQANPQNNPNQSILNHKSNGSSLEYKITCLALRTHLPFHSAVYDIQSSTRRLSTKDHQSLLLNSLVLSAINYQLHPQFPSSFLFDSVSSHRFFFTSYPSSHFLFSLNVDAHSSYRRCGKIDQTHSHK